MNERLAQQLLIDLEIAHDRFQRREALAWLVLCYDTDHAGDSFTEAAIGCYGPFGSPEVALIEKVKHDASSIDGFVNVIVPLYPPVEWKDEK